jgi:hypothetical protein
MKRYRQQLEEILQNLSVLDSSWRDDFADAVIDKLKKIPSKKAYTRKDLQAILSIDDVKLDCPEGDRFQVGLTAIRLVLDLSKDQFTYVLKGNLNGYPQGISTFKKNPEIFIDALERLDCLNALSRIANTPYVWQDILSERLKGGRGSAITGQTRGRELEDYVEAMVQAIFGKSAYDVRCRFHGAKGITTEKCDFAIPNAQDPHILIEVKAYGATGSKQSDIIGDISRMASEKRHDTILLLFTDGITWHARQNDLRTLIDLQNEGKIARIYTKKMKRAFIHDLESLKGYFGL